MFGDKKKKSELSTLHMDGEGERKEGKGVKGVVKERSGESVRCR